MRIEFELELSEDEQEALKRTIGTNEEEPLETTLRGHARAALQEYLDCYLGKRVSTRGSEILEQRLVLLTLHAFESKIPNETRVSQLFQTTITRSRTMIRNTLARYRSDLGEASQASARAVLEGAIWPGGNASSYQARNPPSNIVELLNQRLLSADPALTRITRLANSSGIYEINKYSYDELCDAFGATKVERK